MNFKKIKENKEFYLTILFVFSLLALSSWSELQHTAVLKQKYPHKYNTVYFHSDILCGIFGCREGEVKLEKKHKKY